MTKDIPLFPSRYHSLIPFLMFLMVFVNLQVICSYLYASSILVDDVRECAQGVLRTFKGESYGEKRIFESDMSDLSVGRIKFDQQKATIVFRGARGLMENINCIGCGSEPTHKGFLDSYSKFDDELLQHINDYSLGNNVSLRDMQFVVSGHSRGSGFVPLVVQKLVEDEQVPINAISAITFSPLGVFTPDKAIYYNTMVGNTRQINFLANEDVVSQYVDLGHKWTQWRDEETIYQTVGKTISFDASDFPEFNEFIDADPYRYLMRGAFPVKWQLTPTQWGAHLPETYEMLAPQIYEQYLATGH